MPEHTTAKLAAALSSIPAIPREMVQRAIDGEFDASREESAEWAASPEGQETFRTLVDDAVFGGIVRNMEKRSEEGPRP
jgi:hypothetical protein